jgi:4-hydroxy-tetrahydrodipicolinate synthase
MHTSKPLEGSNLPLEGVIPAIITPLQDNGTLDVALLEKQASYLSSAGVQGLFVNGTTGEGPYLTIDEKLEAFRHVKQIAQGRQFLCAACLQPSTELVLQEIRQIEALEPDFIVVVTPYYYAASQEVIFQHYCEVAKQSPAPVIVYDIPSRTHNPIAFETRMKLSHIENIAGLKDSTGDFVTFSRGIYTDVKPGLAWIQGEDYLDGPAFLSGANGIVTGLGNVWIEPYLAMYEAFKASDSDGIHQAQKQINALYEIIQLTGGKAIPAIKAGAMCFGRSSARMKIAALSLDDAEIDRIRHSLADSGILS